MATDKKPHGIKAGSRLKVLQDIRSSVCGYKGAAIEVRTTTRGEFVETKLTTGADGVKLKTPIVKQFRPSQLVKF